MEYDCINYIGSVHIHSQVNLLDIKHKFWILIYLISQRRPSKIIFYSNGINSIASTHTLQKSI